jgi:flagellar hook protein FlgE
MLGFPTFLALARLLLSRLGKRCSTRSGRHEGEPQMSLFGAMYTAISGLTAQAAAFSNISNNVANSQTVGYKAVGTDFQDYLTQSNANENDSGTVISRPNYENDVQGTLTPTSAPLNLAISGQGFFGVSETEGTTTTGQPVFSQQQYYTRTGDFSLDDNGYLVNSAGQTLDGWKVNATTGVVDQSALVPIQVTVGSYPPTATGTINLDAGLPATAPTPSTTGGPNVTSQLQVYDALGTAHTVTLNWTQTSNGVWNVQVVSPDDTVTGTNGSSPASTPGDLGTATVTFGGSTSGAVDTTAASGTPSGISVDSNDGGTITAPAANTTNQASFTFVANFGEGAQNVTINLGNYGSTTGTTQYAGTSYVLNGLTQDGVPPGTFSSVTTTTAGDIQANYSNGKSQTIAQVPLITFDAPDKLQSVNGQAYTATNTSGTPLIDPAGSGRSGTLVTSAVEASNVDLATELSSLIVAQQAYSANAKVVTSADTLLQVTLNMKQA